MTRAESAANNACCSGHDHSGHDHHSHPAAVARDPVCGMTVDPATSKHRFDNRGETVQFC